VWGRDNENYVERVTGRGLKHSEIGRKGEEDEWEGKTAVGVVGEGRER